MKTFLILTILLVYITGCESRSEFDFYRALAKRESNNKKDAVNSLGYLGLYQMGELALIDAGYYKKANPGNNDWKGQWTGKDGIKSKEDFLKNERAQNLAVRAYHNKLWTYLKGEQKYVGKKVGGIKITKSGLIAFAHLLGPGGVKKFIASDGKDDPKDAFGTKGSEYLKLFSGYRIRA